MMTFVVAAFVFLAGYLINIFYITVLYHRGLTHQSVTLNPFMLKWLNWTGIWITGIDPKAWACMHRLHHMHSDTDQDPHSPHIYGVLGVATAQLRSYENALRNLIRKNQSYTKVVSDIYFDVNFLNREKLWLAPYFLHLVIAVLFGSLSHSGLIGAAYFFGIMSHPIQGWMVNALAHKYGYRNFKTKDQSTNNHIVSVLTFGEGYQNNHHARPKRANFAIRSSEIDFGYGLCLVAQKFRLLNV